jgi:hypothetical protein
LWEALSAVEIASMYSHRTPSVETLRFVDVSRAR